MWRHGGGKPTTRSRLKDTIAVSVKPTKEETQDFRADAIYLAGCKWWLTVKPDGDDLNFQLSCHCDSADFDVQIEGDVDFAGSLDAIHFSHRFTPTSRRSKDVKIGSIPDDETHLEVTLVVQTASGTRLPAPLKFQSPTEFGGLYSAILLVGPSMDRLYVSKDLLSLHSERLANIFSNPSKNNEYPLPKADLVGFVELLRVIYPTREPIRDGETLKKIAFVAKAYEFLLVSAECERWLLDNWQLYDLTELTRMACIFDYDDLKDFCLSKIESKYEGEPLEEVFKRTDWKSLSEDGRQKLLQVLTKRAADQANGNAV